MKRTLTGFLLTLGMLISASTVFGQATMPVPDTGQTTCCDASGNVITCPSPGEPFHGQDGNYTINPPSYTDLGNGVVRDNVTGLYWELKKNRDDVPNFDDPRDADNTYTWCDTNPSTNGGNPGECGANDTMDFTAALNTARHGGYDDWRIPTVEELRSIVDYGRFPLAVNTAFFPNTAWSHYWSSNTVVNLPYSFYSWVVYFFQGNADYYAKSTSCNVRAVRGGQPPPANRYIDHGDGTVTDTVTGLMWQKDTARGTSGNYDEMTWQEALSYCETSTLGDYSDWRLPTINELSSLVDRTRSDPAIDITSFPNTVTSSAYWSSTTVRYRTDFAWSVLGSNGDDTDYNKLDGFFVRAVRGGQPIIVSPTSGLTTTESGVTATFTIVLSAPPIADVTVSLSSSDPGEGTVSPTSVTFTPVNWNTPQTVTVTGVDDGTVDGDTAYTIVIEPAVSADPNYNGIDPPDVSVTNTDDDVQPNASPAFFPVKGQDGKTAIIFVE